MANSEHTSKQFDADLEDIRSRVLQMGGLVEIQLTTAIEGLATGGEDIISRVIETERRVNNYEKEIDDACVHVVARRQPAASDLRLIMSVSKIVTDLERMGDEAEKIARMARSIYGRGALTIPRSIDLRQAGNKAAMILRRVLGRAAKLGYGVKVGFEYEFYVFAETAFSIREKGYRNLKPISPGFFGYSMLRNSVLSDFYRDLLAMCETMDMGIEGLHTETGAEIGRAHV